MRVARLKAVSAAVPEHQVRLEELDFSSSEVRKAFIEKVGVSEKRSSNNKLTASDLCYRAANNLLREISWDSKTVGILVLVTQSPDYLMPSTSFALQSKLNLPQSCLVFDVNLGCSGWVTGLSIVSSLMQTMGISRGLLLAGETSVLTSENDMSYFPLMGDAGTATALELSSTAAPMNFQFYSDGSSFKAIHAPNSGARLFAEGGASTELRYQTVMDSSEVLRFCLHNVIPEITEFMSTMRADVENVDYFLFHQANKLINETIRQKLKIPEEKYPYSIDLFGNTSSASIPLTMVTQLAEELKSEKRLVCCGFGVGLASAIASIDSQGFEVLELINVKLP